MMNNSMRQIEENRYFDFKLMTMNSIQKFPFKIKTEQNIQLFIIIDSIQ